MRFGFIDFYKYQHGLPNQWLNVHLCVHFFHLLPTCLDTYLNDKYTYRFIRINRNSQLYVFFFKLFQTISWNGYHKDQSTTTTTVNSVFGGTAI